MQLEEPKNLADVNVDAPLGQHSKALLRCSRDELTEVADPRSLVHHLIVSHVPISLSRHIDHPGVGVKVGHQHPTGGVNVLNLQGLLQVLLAPHRILPVRVFREASREKVPSVADEDNLGGLGAGVGLALGEGKLDQNILYCLIDYLTD